jgi:hypothetical protein
VDGAELGGLDVDSMSSSIDYFAYLCIAASETTLHEKRMLIADRSHLRRRTVETSCKNELCWLDRAAAERTWVTVVL